MPATALRHFTEDIDRSRALIQHADTLPSGSTLELQLRSDLLRSGWMFAVGALDAYFSDAYTDIVAATIIAKSRQESISLPEFFLNIQFPVSAIVESYDQNTNWRWRMAARGMMADKNFTQLKVIQKSFNSFFRKRHKFFIDLIPGWIVDPAGNKRMFGVTSSDFQSMD